MEKSQLGQGPCNTHSKQDSKQLGALASAGSLSQPSREVSPSPEIRAKAPALSHSRMGMWGTVSMATRPSSAQWQF